jgi:hypothetical protein
MSLSDARKTFQVAFWETDDSTNRSAIVREYDNDAEARAEIARELTAANYKVAGLYEWNGESWTEIRLFRTRDFPQQDTLH